MYINEDVKELLGRIREETFISVEDIEEYCSGYLDNPRYIAEYIWQQGSHILNNNKEKLSKVIDIFESNMLDTRCRHNNKGKKVYRGLVIKSSKELTNRDITEKVFNWFKNRQNDYFSVSEDLCTANDFAKIGSENYTAKSNWDNDQDPNIKKYGIVLVMGMEKGYYVNQRDLNESEYITKYDYVNKIHIKGIYEIKYIRSTLKDNFDDNAIEEIITEGE